LIEEVFNQLIDIAVCFGMVGYYYSSSKVKERGAGHLHRLQKLSQGFVAGQVGVHSQEFKKQSTN